jgi:hypothetical protein
MKIISFSILLITGTVLTASEDDTADLNTRYLFSLNRGIPPAD